jgi:glucokinase
MSIPLTPVSATVATPFHVTPRLLADIGGTNARFALELGPGRIEHVEILRCADHATPAEALQTYLSLPHIAANGAVRHAAIAIANPVLGDVVRMTNHHWTFSIAALGRQMGFDTFVVVNDFAALAMALPHLGDGEKRQIGGGTPVPDAPIGLVGAGTGLGVSGLVPSIDGGTPRWTALRSEGGHATFAPADETEVDILRFAWREFGHVSAERLLSGAGIGLIYRALASRHGRAVEAPHAATIVQRGLSGACPLCDETVEIFCGVMGTVAGNLALTLGARGGIYIGGGIAPRLGQRLDRSRFRSRFEDKGRLADYLAQVPCYIITAAYPAFTGVSAMLAQQLAGLSS